MFVWSGKGIFAIFVFLASAIIFGLIFPGTSASYGFGFCFIVTAVFSWFMGKKWNDQDAKMYIDEDSGQKVIVKGNHTIFWIKLQYWGPIFLLIGLYFISTKFF
ncbi:hypothetical protein [Flammeovirga aprica]|uniref:Uncharacterized protein n=1 Tax=Flammeovirga aprica JL-4 TaxID=694437 RepID=A0A7X9XD01_9BACT|nr:hypothetical protein [Flammeovirga aprica]NME72386.1 hypothetical protein [Flammeovirga aprica JL-4]